eukprot:TRINITY_DN775926_c0_g1_i1.p1 TRINITY_DN775926_c0_g1~~TRINITY_DN775926_c0_g1_i1.p1  ORF type:complete len:347 (-),score=41.04 TRINITY_DN775926_c0_g1_i1:56-1096(-)
MAPKVHKLTEEELQRVVDAAVKAAIDARENEEKPSPLEVTVTLPTGEAAILGDSEGKILPEWAELAEELETQGAKILVVTKPGEESVLFDEGKLRFLGRMIEAVDPELGSINVVSENQDAVLSGDSLALIDPHIVCGPSMKMFATACLEKARSHVSRLPAWCDLCYPPADPKAKCLTYSHLQMYEGIEMIKVVLGDVYEAFGDTIPEDSRMEASWVFVKKALNALSIKSYCAGLCGLMKDDQPVKSDGPARALSEWQRSSEVPIPLKEFAGLNLPNPLVSKIRLINDNAEKRLKVLREKQQRTKSGNRQRHDTKPQQQPVIKKSRQDPKKSETPVAAKVLINTNNN